MELIVLKHERRLSQIEALNDMPLYPTEQVLWDETIVPHETYSDGCLALPKLNVQFLTMHDYLLRNLNLFRLESTYDIRTDMEDVIPRMKAFQNASGETQFAGYVPRAAKAQRSVSYHARLPAAQPQSVPPRVHVRYPHRHGGRHPTHESLPKRERRNPVCRVRASRSVARSSVSLYGIFDIHVRKGFLLRHRRLDLCLRLSNRSLHLILVFFTRLQGGLAWRSRLLASQSWRWVVPTLVRRDRRRSEPT